MDSLHDLCRRPAPGVQTRWSSFENPSAAKGSGGTANRGGKGAAFEGIAAGETKTLLDIAGSSGRITRLWMTVDDRSPKTLRALRLEAFWDGALMPAVSVPLGDFFGIGLGRRGIPFENALFSDPEGRSFNCFAPMPFRTAARLTLTNEGETDLPHLFYDADLLLGGEPDPDALYFHAHWRRESPNALGRPFAILPHVTGTGRFLGCNVGVKTDPTYADSWWGEGEVKIWLDGDGDYPTLCGTGAEDYIGTGWGLGAYAHRTQGCTVADGAQGEWAFYRYHIDDPVYFHQDCRVAIDAIGGASIARVRELQQAGAALMPLTLDAQTGRTINLLERTQPVDLADPALPSNAWCNFYRQDDWSATAYFMLDRPENGLPVMDGRAP